jgi:cytochrome b subunit of formate dehydrogenase
MEEKNKKLKKMATWTIAIFATVFAVTFAVLWLPIYPTSTSALDAIGKVFAASWLILVADLVLCVLVYVGYSAYIKNQK